MFGKVSTRMLAGTLGLMVASAGAASVSSVVMAETMPSLAALFPRVAAQVVVSPSHASVLHFGTATVKIAAGTFQGKVRFMVREGFLGSYRVPSGEKAIFDFAFQVTTLAGAPVPVPFQKPVLFSLRTPALSGQSVYYNVAPNGSLAVNPKGLSIRGKTLSHPINTDMVGWVITSPAGVTAQGPLASEFPNVVASRVVMPSRAAVFVFDNGSVKIPAHTFMTAVRFTVLQGPLSGFKTPAGSRPIFDFAFQVTTLKGQPVPVPFSELLQFALHDSMLTPRSAYYNVTATGTLVLNPKGMTIHGQMLTHPINTDVVGWLITSPVSSSGMSHA
jgi:hypothetical protein